jgi:hypothetical protein
MISRKEMTDDGLIDFLQEGRKGLLTVTHPNVMSTTVEFDFPNIERKDGISSRIALRVRLSGKKSNFPSHWLFIAAHVPLLFLH